MNGPSPVAITRIPKPVKSNGAYRNLDDKTWRQRADFSKGDKRRELRVDHRYQAAELICRHPLPAMVVLTEVVTDLFEEYMLLRSWDEKSQYLYPEISLRLQNSMQHGGAEWDPYRRSGVPIANVAVMCGTAWSYLFRLHQCNYLRFDNLLDDLSHHGPKVARKVMNRTKKQSIPFRHKPVPLAEKQSGP